MGSHWVCKPDGRIQCLDTPEIPLAEMRKSLALLIGDDNIVGEKKISVITPALCGIPAGTRNAYEITDEGYWILEHGFVGPMGFEDCPGDTHAMPEITDSGEGQKPNFAVGLALTGLGSAATTPVLVRDLIGHPVRVYEKGTVIAMDYIPGRVDIVTKDGAIVDIRYG